MTARPLSNVEPSRIVTDKYEWCVSAVVVPRQYLPFAEGTGLHAWQSDEGTNECAETFKTCD